MIEFKFNEDGVKRAVFAGKTDDLTAEMLMAVSILYGSLKLKNEKAAREFKQDFIGVMLKKEGRQTVFSDKLAKWLLSDVKKRGGVAVLECAEAKAGEDSSDSDDDDAMELLEKIMSEDDE